MNIALIGFGAMGKQIFDVSLREDLNIVSVIDPSVSQKDLISSISFSKEINQKSLSNCDLAIDFSAGRCVKKNVENCIENNINLIIGSTGWGNQIEEIESIVKKSKIGVLWSFNFSIGVNLFYQMVEKAAHLINDFDEYDVWAHEIHHRHKVDSPSGTAKDLEKILLTQIDRKNSVVEDRLNRKIEEDEIHFSSTRGGDVNFAHSVAFDSAADTIKISHSARNRSGYALGAIKAAKWLNKKSGFFCMNDFLNFKHNKY